METIDRTELKRHAKKVLKGNLGLVIGSLVIMLLINTVLGGIPVLGWLALLVVPPITSYGVQKIFLKISREEHTQVNTLFDGFSIFLTIIISDILVGLIISVVVIITILAVFIITMVLPWYAKIALIIMSVSIMTTTVSLGLSLTKYIIIDLDGDIKATQAIKTSWEIMDGYKWELLKLQFSFIGWILMGAFTFGIAYIWVAPYIGVTTAGFYDQISNKKGMVKRQR